MLRPTHIAPEIGTLLRQIDQLKVGTIPIQDLPPAERERWIREYAECASYHGARLDEYVRTVSG